MFSYMLLSLLATGFCLQLDIFQLYLTHSKILNCSRIYE